MLVELVTKVYEFAPLGQKIIDAEWAGSMFHQGKLKGMMVLSPALEPNVLSYKLNVHVQMHISSKQGNILLCKTDVELEVVFQTEI